MKSYTKTDYRQIFFSSLRVCSQSMRKEAYRDFYFSLATRHIKDFHRFGYYNSEKHDRLMNIFERLYNQKEVKLKY